MRTLTPSLFVLAAAVAVPLLLLSQRATAEPGPPASTLATSDEAAAASASASMSASAAPTAPPLRKLSALLAAEPLPTTTSRAPRHAAWKDAERLAVPGGNSGCNVHLIREWLHVRCDRGDVIDVSLLSGDASGVALAVAGEEFQTSADIVLPLRKGKSEVVSITSAQFGRYGSGLPESAGLLWVLWPESAEAPVVRLE